MQKNHSFRNKMKCLKAKEAQKNISMEAIISQVFREMGNLDPKNEKQPKLEQLVETIARRYNLVCTSEITKNMEELLNSGKYLWKVDQEGYMVSNYQKGDLKQKAYNDEENRRVNEKFNNFVGRLQEIYERLPEDRKNDVEAIKSEFKSYELERNSLLISLAVRKVWGYDLNGIHPQKQEIMER